MSDMKHSLSFKLNIPLISISLIVLIALSIIANIETQKRLDESIQKETQYIYSTIFIATKNNHSKSNLTRIASSLAAQENITRLSLMHSESQIIIADNDHSRLGEKPESSFAPIELKIFNEFLTSDRDFKTTRHKDNIYQLDTIYLIDPDVNRFRPYIIYLVYNKTFDSYASRVELIKFIIIFSIGILLMFVTIYLIQRKVLIAPLHNMANIIKQQKKTSRRLTLPDNNAIEINILSQQYNELTQENFKREAELQTSNESLQSQDLALRVSEEELRASNESLQKQAMTLRASEEELQASNENLQKQAMTLKASEEELKTQSEELLASNETLSQNSQKLFMQKEEIEVASKNLQVKSKELALASKYKSEFLANMSHELRTPLNSVLLLAKYLSQNKKGNLDEVQIRDLEVIYESGCDLLSLMNDILDLTKVEAGKLSLTMDNVDLSSSMKNLMSLFKLSAENKGLKFASSCEKTVPSSIITDSQRLEQILKNFLSNAFKFTRSGSVKLKIHLPTSDTHFVHSNLHPLNSIGFSVIDTGIGIPEDMQQEIFGAFQQEDGSTSRRYGGTGLGLTISRELALKLGGEILLRSTQGQGSTFSLFLPLEGVAVVDDDASNANAINSLMATPAIASTLQITDPTLSEQFIAGDASQLSTGVNRILVIEDDVNSQRAITQLVKDRGMNVECVDTGTAAIEKVSNGEFYCLILDIGLPDITGFDVLKQLSTNKSYEMPPVIIYTGKELTKEERKELQKYSATIVLKGAEAPEKLLDEALLFMRSMTKKSALQPKKIIYNLNDESALLKNRKILLADDDMRNTFVLCRCLREAGLNVIEAANGQIALEKVAAHDDIELIVMDIMMPIMDGYEAMKRIRQIEKYRDVPIIALTAKAMSEDRKLCIEAGATDYLTKPIDFDKLLSMLQVWLFKK